MTPDFINKWELILENVEKSKVPVQFIKKILLKLDGKRQHTINISKLVQQGLDPEQLENVISNKLTELNDEIIGVEFILDVQAIAETIQPETDELLKNL